MRRSNSKVRILLKKINLNLTPMIIYPRSICTSFEFFPWDLNPTGLQKNIYTYIKRLYYRFWQMSTSALNCIDDGWRRERKKHRCEILHLIFHFESWFVCMYYTLLSDQAVVYLDYYTRGLYKHWNKMMLKVFNSTT